MSGVDRQKSAMEQEIPECLSRRCANAQAMPQALIQSRQVAVRRQIAGGLEKESVCSPHFRQSIAPELVMKCTGQFEGDYVFRNHAGGRNSANVAPLVSAAL
jgi:hypothetical protein